MIKPLFFLLLLSFCIIAGAHAQTTTTTIKEDLSDGGTKTTTTVTEVSETGLIHKREEYRNADGKLLKSRDVREYKKGDLNIVDSMYNAGGKVSRTTVRHKQSGGDTTYAEEVNYDNTGMVILESQKRLYQDGNIKITRYGQGRGTTFGTRNKAGDPGPLPAREPDTVGEPILFPIKNVKEWMVDSYRITGEAGYSYLQSGSGDGKISFPLGAHISFEYMLTPKIGLVADGSYHTKKEDDYRISRMFLLGGLEYIFYGMSEQKRNDFLLFVRLMAGVAKDRQKITFGPTYTDTYNAFAIAAGLGLAYPLNGSIFLQLIPDYIITRFNDESQGNIRVSAGVKYVFRRSPGNDNY